MTDFTREDVIKQLADMGYKNVDEAKLDSFCEDLKKLIRYEEKKRRVDVKLDLLTKSQRELQESRDDNYDGSSTEVNTKRKRRIRKEDKRRKKEEKAAAKLLKSQQSSYDESSAEISTDVRERSHTSQRSEALDVNDESSSIYIDIDLPHPSRSSSSLSRKTPPLAVSLLEQPQSGFIRVRSGPSVGKKGLSSDPVALHQKYKECWAKSNIPGEKRHDKLRWAVRGWMMGEEPV